MITKKEAMKDYYDEGYTHGYTDGYMDGYYDAKVDYGEELNKIRAELKAKSDDVDFGDKKEYEEGVQFGLMLAYQIVNKVEDEG